MERKGKEERGKKGGKKGQGKGREKGKWKGDREEGWRRGEGRVA